MSKPEDNLDDNQVDILRHSATLLTLRKWRMSLNQAVFRTSVALFDILIT